MKSSIENLKKTMEICRVHFWIDCGLEGQNLNGSKFSGQETSAFSMILRQVGVK